MQARDHSRFFVRHRQFNQLSRRPQRTAQLRKQRWNSIARCGRHSNRPWKTINVFFQHVARAEAINFVENHQDWFAVCANFFEHRVHRQNLFLGLRMADVHNVQKQISLDDFLEVALNASTNRCGSLRINPTVSDSKTFWFVGRRSRRVVGSSVAKRMSSAKTEAPVNLFKSVDLPAFV